MSSTCLASPIPPDRLTNDLVPLAIVAVVVVLLVILACSRLFVSLRHRPRGTVSARVPAEEPSPLPSSAGPPPPGSSPIPSAAVPSSVAPPTSAFGLSLTNPVSGQSYPLKLPVIIGRAADCGVRLESPTVSAHHARIYDDPLAQGICIQDLGSLNGLYVQGQLTCRNVIHDSVQIRIGDIVLTFRDTGYLSPNL